MVIGGIGKSVLPFTIFIDEKYFHFDFRGSDLSDVSIIRRMRGVEVLALRWVNKYCSSITLFIHIKSFHLLRGVDSRYLLTQYVACFMARIHRTYVQPHPSMVIGIHFLCPIWSYYCLNVFQVQPGIDMDFIDQVHSVVATADWWIC